MQGYFGETVQGAEAAGKTETRARDQSLAVLTVFDDKEWLVVDLNRIFLRLKVGRLD